MLCKAFLLPLEGQHALPHSGGYSRGLNDKEQLSLSLLVHANMFHKNRYFCASWQASCIIYLAASASGTPLKFGSPSFPTGKNTGETPATCGAYFVLMHCGTVPMPWWFLPAPFLAHGRPAPCT